MKKILVFQHIECEHPGSLRAHLKENGLHWDTVHLNAGDPIPCLEAYDALWVMGGPMDVWDEKEYPWLIEEKAAIRHWVCELKKPYLGLCLGHQLLADALGGVCGLQTPPEIGLLQVELTKNGQNDPIFANMPVVQDCLQWHSVCVEQVPKNTVVLAQSDVCAVQAMRVGNHAWSMQYHVEIEQDTVDNWAQIPAYREALMSTIGEEGLDKMREQAKARMDTFLLNSKQLFLNFLKAL